MRLSGYCKLEGINYILVYNATKDVDTWYLYTPYTVEDRRRLLYGEMTEDVVRPIQYFEKKSDIDYLISSVKRYKTKNEVVVYKEYDKLLKVITELSKVRNYSFAPSEIFSNDIATLGVDGSIVDFFDAKSSGGVGYTYKRVDGVYTLIEVSALDVEFKLDDIHKVKIPRGLVYEDATNRVEKKVNVISVDKVTLKDLERVVNLDWYQEYKEVNGEQYRVIKKKYTTHNTIKSFELDVITPMVNKILENKRNGQFTLIGLDTETDGVNIYWLPDDNPNKNKISTLQLSWENDQGALMYIDMEYFNNIPGDYVIERLYPLFQEDRVDFDYVVKDLIDGKIVERTVRLNRNDIKLVGHNVMFDGRVCYDVRLSDDIDDKYETPDGYKRAQYFFDEDTLQMVFNINPTFTKGHKGLKDLTKKFFGFEPAELSDVLGKGNEDKFRYLVDEEVARIYACADTDNTRKVWFALREIMDDKMYKAYQVQDPYTWFMLYQSEYYGLPLDEVHLKKASDIIEKDLDSLKEFIYNYTGYMLTLKNIRESILDKFGINIPKRTQIDLIQKELAKQKGFKPYVFKIGGNDIKDVLYNKLEYPITAYTDKHEPSVNKVAFEKLMAMRTDKNRLLFMKEDLISADGETVLIDKDEFHNYRFPLAYVLSKYKELDKEYSGYYKPFKTGDQGGRLFRSYSTTNIETKRISNPIQTTKKQLKKCIVAHGPDWNAANWDLNQVEARIFVSFARDERMIVKLNNSEKDYHTENAALVFDKNPWEVPKDLRKAAKSLSFGIPYGLGERKMCERIHGVINEVNMIDTRRKLQSYTKTNKLTMDELESYRKSAVQEWNMPEGQRFLMGIDKNHKVSHITNKFGFHRVFDLDAAGGDIGKLKSIERAAGNYPIQSYAAELFRLLLRRFYIRLKKEHLRGKVLIHMLVHDEIQFSFHKSVNPAKIMEMVKEECMVKVKNHCTYFVGLNFGHSWYECKQDENECPVKFVEEMTERYKNNELGGKFEYVEDVKEWITPYMHDFFVRRVGTVLNEMQPSLYKEHKLDFNLLLQTFSNYTVRAYTTSEFGNALGLTCDGDTVRYDLYHKDMALLNGICGWARDYGMLDLLIDINDESHSVAEMIADSAIAINALGEATELGEIIEGEDEDIDLSVSDDDNWSFEDNDSISSYVNNSYIPVYWEDSEEKTDLNEFNVVTVFSHNTPSYNNIKVLHGDTVIIEVPRDDLKMPLARNLVKFRDDVDGQYMVKIRSKSSTLKCFKINTDKFDLDTLDKYMGEVLKQCR